MPCAGTASNSPYAAREWVRRSGERLERRQWRQIDPGVFLVNRGERPILRIDEYPGIDPLPQLEVARAHDGTIERGGHQQLVFEMLAGIRVGHRLFGKCGHGGGVDLT